MSKEPKSMAASDQSSNRNQISFGTMTAAHIPEIGTIERRNYDFYWSDGIFKDCVKSGYVCRLVMQNNDIIGYGVMQIGADEAHVLNVCIDKPWQKKGYARLLLEYLASEAVSLGAYILFLEVRPSNERAVALYQQAGFNEIGLRKGYYDSASGREDALVMALNLPGAASDQQRL